MKNILLNYFQSVYSIETFLKECNLKLKSLEDELKFYELVQRSSLSKIVLCFDFKLNGPFKSYIDKRYSYEKLLYLCYVKINESDLPMHMDHYFRDDRKSNNGNGKKMLPQINDNFSKMSDCELEKKMLMIENLSLSYFLATKQQNSDGYYWKELFNLIGSSIMKHVLLNAYIFRRLESSPSYVQVCGCRFNQVHKNLIANELDLNEKLIRKKLCESRRETRTENKALKITTNPVMPLKAINNIMQQNNENNQIPKQTIVNNKAMPLNKVFGNREEELLREYELSKSSVEAQLKKTGNQTLNKTSILYDRNLSTKVPKKYIYSDLKLDSNLNETSKQIIKNFIFKNVDFKTYSGDKNDLSVMLSELVDLVKLFVVRFRSCPFKIFLHDNCIRNLKNNTNQQNKSFNKKRKLNGDEASNPNLTNVSVDKRDVFKFLRRVLMYLFDYQNKSNTLNKKYNETGCGLVGGKHNADQVIKKCKPIIGSLKYDHFVLNSFLQGIKQSRFDYLKSVKCDRFKTLLVLSLLRWIFEDVVCVILKAHFYITDTSKTNFELFFYLKSTWKSIVFSQLTDPAKKNYKNLYNLEKIKETDAISYCSQYQSNGICLGRLLPKNVNNECRIISGCRIYNPCTKKTYAMNYKFITLNNCLNWLIDNDPGLTGFGCKGQVDIHNRYSKFLNLNSLNRSNEISPAKKWNFMKFDIEKCFDSIDNQQIMNYVSDLFAKRLGNDHLFTIIRHIKLKYDLDYKNLTKRFDYLTLRHHNHEKGFMYGIWDYIKLIESNKKATSNQKECTIFVPWYISERNISLKQLRDLLRKCLQHVLIKIHNDIYERMSGILQGSVCSRNLCDLYLGRIEQKLFSYDSSSSGNRDAKQMMLNKSNDLILRVVDDYLVISSSYDRLIEIKNLIKSEAKFNETKTDIYKYDDYKPISVDMKNLFKTKSNISILIDSIEGEEEEEEELGLCEIDIDFLSNYSRYFFSWCGFNIDVKTLDIYFNYEKYFSNESKSNLNSRLNLTNDFKHPFILFNLKFLRLFAYNASSVMVTSLNINSLQAILRNYVDFFALSSIRFFLLFKYMPQELRKETKLQLKLITNLCYHLNNNVDAKMKTEFLQYYYSFLSLIKFICFRTFLIMIEKFDVTKSSNKFTKLIKRQLFKLDFKKRCIKMNNDVYFMQINKLIEEQVVKFYSCKLT